MNVLVSLLLIVLALLGTPLFIIIAASAMFGFYQSEVDLSVVAIEIYRLAEMPILLAIPLFTFAGYLLSESGAPARLVRVTQAPMRTCDIWQKLSRVMEMRDGFGVAS